MKWLRNFDEVIFQSTAYDIREEEINWLMENADVNEVNKIASALAKEEKSDNNKEITFNGTYEEYAQIIPKTQEESFFCNKCRRFFLASEYAQPTSGWNSFGKKHASQIVAKCLIDDVFYHYSGNKSIKTKILLSVNKEDEYFNSLNINEKDFEMKDGDLVFKCPVCGEVLNVKLSSWGYHEKNGYSLNFLRRDSKWKTSNKMRAYYNIYSDNGTPFVSISQVSFSFFPNPRGRMHVKATKRRMTFNTETGQTYAFVERDMDTNKPEFDGPKIANITYSNNCYMPISKEEADELSEKICEKKDIKTIKLDEITEKGTPDEKVKMINRYGQLGADFISSLMTIEHTWGKAPSKLKREYYNLSKNNDIFLKKIAKEKIKGKKRIKLYAKNPCLFIIEPIFKNIGFSDNNILLTFCENANIVMRFACKAVKPYTKDQFYHSTGVQKFVCAYKSVRTESELAKKIIADKRFLFSDSCRMYERISQKMDLQKQDLIRLFSGTISEIHERLCNINNALSYIPYFIPYNKDEKWFNCKCGKYTFELAKNSAEMQDVGKDMKICVGSYASSAASKRCYIVFMRKEGKMQACIEINSDQNKLVQAKDYCNKVVEEEKWPALKKFLKMNKIKYDNCYDIPDKFIETKEETEFEWLKDSKDYMIFETFEDMKTVPLSKEQILDGIRIPLIGSIEEPITPFEF